MNIKEILVLHHSHFDLGYTHSQPILWEMQREFIDQALDMLDKTQDWPEISKPRWTCEVTAQVMKWLKTANLEKFKKFKKYLHEKRIGISAMEYCGTPGYNIEQWSRLLYNAKFLEDLFEIKIKTVNQHDVNGLAWPMVDLMIDSGIKLLTMAVNIHFGGNVGIRPSVFRWESPSGRDILVMNGQQYTMFDQFFYSWEDSIERMADGLKEYIWFLEQKQYKYDFVYLTTTNTAGAWDNSSPNMAVAKLIKKWNNQKNDPVIRYVTPELLLERILKLPADKHLLYKGDWPDFWSFGAASSARETAINLGTKPRLYISDFLRASRDIEEPYLADISKRAWWHLNAYDEHTWGNSWSMHHDHPNTTAQWHFKAHLAREARELSEYLLIHELEVLAKNPVQGGGFKGMLLVNTTGSERICHVPVPDLWKIQKKSVRYSRFTFARHLTNFSYDAITAPCYGPVTIKPFSWKIIPFDQLKPVCPSKKVTVHDNLTQIEQKTLFDKSLKNRVPGDGYIESPWYKLEYCCKTGRITQLFDKKRDWDIIPPDSEYTFFEVIHEQPDPLYDSERTALYDRDISIEKLDIPCWKTDWKARRQHAVLPKGCHVEEGETSATLVLEFEVVGVDGFQQRITLHDNTPVIDLGVCLMKKDIRTPESLYFVFPLNIEQGWSSHYDTSGVPVEIGAQHLPGCCRDWFMVNSYASIHTSSKGATLYCPEAPMVQIGDFNFARKNPLIERRQNPLLLAWPLNNCWDTNFRASQPGYIMLRYAFRTHGPFDPERACNEGQIVSTPVEYQMVVDCEKEKEKEFIKIAGDGIHLQHIKRAENGIGIIIRLICLKNYPVYGNIKFIERKISKIFVVSPVEEDKHELLSADNKLNYKFVPFRITSFRIVF